MKTGIKRLEVSLNLEGQQIQVGELVSDGDTIFFKYYPAFLDRGFEISPFKLPLSDEIVSTDTQIFDGLFGVFSDSLPDGWGRLLMDRSFIAQNISLNEITPLDRLSCIGENGMGALQYHLVNSPDLNTAARIELDDIAEQALRLLQGQEIENLDELLQMGGSSGGARPKILVGHHPEKDHLIHHQNILPKGYAHWIIKFRSSSDFIDAAEIEFAYYRMALDAGIVMSECKLFKGMSGKKYFGTRRFDRIGNTHLHLHSAAGLLHDHFRLSSMDYGHLMDAAFRLENHVQAYEKLLRIAAFNVFTHNRDDHSKNFSFLMNESQEWKLAPAYDLTFSPRAFHSTTVAGEGRQPDEVHLLELAKGFGIANPERILDQVKNVISDWNKYAGESDVSRTSQELIWKLFEAS